jgi:hypothetical protein
MKELIIFLLMGFLSFTGCKDKDPKITQTTELSEEMKAYFVNYEVGTKWIYQDTINPNIYDTIELVSKKNIDINNGGTLEKGFELYFVPKMSKDFKITANPGASNKCFVKIDPLVNASGAVIFENKNNIWTTNTNFYDSLIIDGSTFYEVIGSDSHNSYQYHMKLAKNLGIIFFRSENANAQSPWSAHLKLIKIVKP